MVLVYRKRSFSNLLANRVQSAVRGNQHAWFLPLAQLPHFIETIVNLTQMACILFLLGRPFNVDGHGGHSDQNGQSGEEMFHCSLLLLSLKFGKWKYVVLVVIKSALFDVQSLKPTRLKIDDGFK